MKNNIIYGLVIFLTGLIMGFLISFKGCNSKPGKQTQLLHTDTVTKFTARTDTLYKTVQITNNIPYTVIGHDTVRVRETFTIVGHDTSYVAQHVYQSDTAIYRDTLRRENEFKAELFDTLINNRIHGREVRWANLSPVEVKTVTNTVEKKQALLKVYLGANVATNISPSYKPDFIPKAAVIFKDKYLFEAGYGIIQQRPEAGVLIKLHL